MSGITTTPAEALKEENLVKIALWNGKIFRAGIIDVLEGGKKLHVAKLMKNGVPNRKEILTVGYGYGNIRTIAGVGCKHVLKGISGDRVLSYNNRKLIRTFSSEGKKKSTTRGVIYKTEPNHDFALFLASQEEFRKGQDLDLKILNRKISEYEEKKKMGINNKFSPLMKEKVMT